MSFRQWLSKKIAGNNYSKTNGSLSELDRMNALMKRRNEHAIKQAERMMEMMDRISKLEYSSNPKESTVDVLLKQAIPILLTKMQNEQITKPQTAINQKIDFTEEQIKAMLDNNPGLKEFASKQTDEQIKKDVLNKIPNISTESLNKIISIIKS